MENINVTMSKMEDPYIYFELNNRKLKINRENSEDIYYWFEKCGDKILKKPYWKKIKFTEKCLYYYCRINKKPYRFHRVVYYAHNQDWDIDNSSSNNLIDHIDENKKNNHISNLRVGNYSLNKQNVSKVKGYGWSKKDKRFQVYICVNYINKYIGQYKTEEEAREAYLTAKKQHHIW